MSIPLVVGLYERGSALWVVFEPDLGFFLSLFLVMVDISTRSVVVML